MGDPDRNFNPTPEARVAWALWSEEYAYQRLGLMDWYDTLDDDRKRRAERNAKEIIEAAIAHKRIGVDQSARIAQLEASLAEAMEALEPFADQAVEYIDDVWNDNDIVDNMQVRVRHLRRARDVYSKREAK